MREAARMLAIGFTSKQVAAHFKVSLSTLYRWVSRVNDARRDEERTP
jgi:transposase